MLLSDSGQAGAYIIDRLFELSAHDLSLGLDCQVPPDLYREAVAGLLGEMRRADIEPSLFLSSILRTG